MTKLCNKNCQSSSEVFQQWAFTEVVASVHVNCEQLLIVASVFVLISVAGLLTCSRTCGGWVGEGINICESPRAGPSPQQQMAEDQLPCSLSTRLSCLQGIHPAGILLGCVHLHSSLNSSLPLSWSQRCTRGALCSTFQWCFYQMLDKRFQCALWKLTCEAVTQTALSGTVCFPELSGNCSSDCRRLTALPCLAFIPRTVRTDSSRVTSPAFATGV